MRHFRSARILPEYLTARDEELRAAVVVQELKRKLKEEQRVIKEQMREEERAQREFERAQQEALKEEETIKKALAKAERDFAKASDDQKALYEAKLNELSGKLKDAEDRNKRALSMAQQTKRGNVYVISNVGSFGENVFKIGLTRRLEPMDRIKELGDASVPFEFDVHAMIPSSDAPALERSLHKTFLRAQVNKVNPRKEFFKLSLLEIKEAVDAVAGLEKSWTWTLTAACKEWRETQALERDLASKAVDMNAWEQKQMKEIDSIPPPAADVE